MVGINPHTSHLLIRYQEIALKGKNRPFFERRLRKNILNVISKYKDDVRDIEFLSGRFVVALKDGKTTDTIQNMIENIAQLGGITAIAPCWITPLDKDAITDSALAWTAADFENHVKPKTFAVRTKRVNKMFPVSSNDMDIAISDRIRKLAPLELDLKHPEFSLHVELRQKHAVIYSDERKGICGLPMDNAQRVVCLLSGGIDSPVAAFEAMRRGCSPILVHFHSKPFTSEESIEKVKKLAAVLRKHSPIPLVLWLVPLLEIQKAVRDVCNERYRTIHYRRFMMLAAQELAARFGAKAIVTGEALGQVASQTLTNLQAIDDVAKLPVLRPLVTADKAQIITKAKALGTYEISIEPHDDSCVLFASLRPSTQAPIASLIQEEEKLSVYKLAFDAVDRAERVIIS